MMAMMDNTEIHKMFDTFLACDNQININYDNATCQLYNDSNGLAYEFDLLYMFDNMSDTVREIADELDYEHDDVISNFIERYNVGDSQGINDVLLDTELSFGISGITFYL